MQKPETRKMERAGRDPDRPREPRRGRRRRHGTDRRGSAGGSDGGIVELCRMSGRGTPFGEAFERCVRQGAKEIIVIPYFLHFGVHLRQDIPEMLREAVAKHPEVRLVLGRHLGYDDALVALVEKRIAESEALCDVRDLPRDADRPPSRRAGDGRLSAGVREGE